MAKKKNWIQEWNEYEKKKRKARIQAKRRRRLEGVVGQVVDAVFGFVSKALKKK